MSLPEGARGPAENQRLLQAVGVPGVGRAVSLVQDFSTSIFSHSWVLVVFLSKYIYVISIKIGHGKIFSPNM